jgi:hypothetical protein
MLPVLLGGAAAAFLLPTWAQQARAGQATAEATDEDDHAWEPPPRDLATRQVQEDSARLTTFLRQEVDAGRALPENTSALYKRWNQVRRYEWTPFDPFDGERYGHERRGMTFVLWSTTA